MRASRSRTARALAHRRALGADAARDLHPGNVRFIALGRLVLLDLGLVGRLDDADRLAFAGLLYTLDRRRRQRGAHLLGERGRTTLPTSARSSSSWTTSASAVSRTSR
ncbi:MAG TPA: AarF/UbiB family protein [Candidatus Binatia bacterium]|nr:AarF/UbiB family protein [Candidatus Binatia bacterium]